MDQAQFNQACAKTYALIQTITPLPKWEPARDLERPIAVWHLAWMLGEAAIFHAAGKTDKANRWLGYVQGVLAAAGVNLELLKRANMPEGEIFDPEKV